MTRTALKAEEILAMVKAAPARGPCRIQNMLDDAFAMQLDSCNLISEAARLLNHRNTNQKPNERR